MAIEDFTATTPATRYAQAKAEALQQGIFGSAADRYVLDNYPGIAQAAGRGGVSSLETTNNQANNQATDNQTSETPAAVGEAGVRALYADAVGSGRPVSQDEINFYLNNGFFDQATPGVIDENERKAFFEAIAGGGETLTPSAQELVGGGGGGGDLDPQGFTQLDKDKFYYTKTTSKFIQGKGMGDTSRTEQVTTYYDQDNNILGTGDAGLAEAQKLELPFSSGPKAPTSQLNANQITKGYQDILFRTPTRTEIESYKNTSRADFIRGLTNSPEYFSPERGIKSIYKEVAGRLPNQQEIQTYLDEFAPETDAKGRIGTLSSFEGKQLAGRLRGEQLDNLRGRLNIESATKIPDETTDSGFRSFFSGFNKAPTNAGISRLRPIPNYGKNTAENITRLYQAETGRTPNQEEIDFYTGQYGENIDPSEVLQFREAPEAQTFQDRLGGAVIQQPFTAPTDVLQRVAYDPEAEGVGPTMADVFGYEAYNPITSPEELAAQDRRAADIAAFTGDESMEGVTPSMIDAGIASVPGLKKGGEVDNMGLEGLGQKMAAYGRYGDTMLAHISPEEAMMLKAMGGSGTRNPVTGLPEFFLKKLVKSIFKIGKKILPAVVAAYNPVVGASLAAADAGFKDGSFDFKKAALAGVKTLALSKAGEAIAGGPIGPESGGLNLSSGYENIPVGLDTASTSTIGQQLTEPFTDPIGFAKGVGDAGTRIGSGFMDAGGKALGGDFSGLKGTAVPLTIAGVAKTTEMGLDEAEKIKREADALNYESEERKRKQREKALAALAPGFGYAQGGISSLAPRYLDGAGDGMSDSIRANIDGQQEARLADGEFVIPADVVADMGNGSSNAGAERLYSMMDRIREARHGTTKQPPEVNVNRMMPA